MRVETALTLTATSLRQQRLYNRSSYAIANPSVSPGWNLGPASQAVRSRLQGLGPLPPKT
jgi:hypothetical protein